MSKVVKLMLVLVLLLSAVAILPTSAQDDAVVIGVNAEYPPFESVDDSDAIIGFDIDLINALAEDAGFEIEFVNTRWDGIFVALSEGEFDAVISAATITDEREEIIDFSDAYFNAGQSIAVQTSIAEDVAGPEDLAGLRVGVQLGTTGDEFASEIDGAEVVRFDEITLAFQALGAGEVDAIVNDGPTSADIIANNPDLDAVLVGEPLTDEFYGIAVNPEQSELLDNINTSLANVIADGTYAEIFVEWFGQSPSSDFLPMADSGDDVDLGTAVIGVNAEYPPFESVDDSDAIIGFDIDLINAISEDAGFEIEFVNTRWDGIFVALSEGEFDAVISAATITDEREEIIDFSDAYFNAGQSIAVQTSLAEDVLDPEDLAGLRVGVQLGTTGDEYASEIDGVEVVRFDEITLAFQALGAGEVDAIVNDGPTSADIIANNPDLDAVLVGEPLTDEFYGIAVNPEQSALLDSINTSLANVIADGTYAEIFVEWFGQSPSSDFLPADDMDTSVDFSDPESVTVGLLSTFFTAEDASEILVFACDGLTDFSLFPDNDTLAGFAGMSLSDISNLSFDVEIDGDFARVEATEGSSITLQIGDTEQELPMTLLLGQLGIAGIDLEQNADGDWLVCPMAE